MDQIPRTFKDNSLKFNLSFSVIYLISEENSGKAVENEVRHTCTLLGSISSVFRVRSLV